MLDRPATVTVEVFSHYVMLCRAGQLMVYMIHRQVDDAACVARTATAAVTFLLHSLTHADTW